MKFSCALFFILAAVFQGSAAAQPPSPASTAVQALTPAKQRIAAANHQIEADPKKSQAYNDLALALIRRARETANPIYYRDAERALTTGLTLAPNDFQLQKTQVALLLGKCEFAQAYEKAKSLNLHTPDDVTTYGYLAEADIALGNYRDAEKAAQWMLNLLPDNIPGLLIGSELRTLYGDPEGALELLNRAFTETSPTETEELAWIANQIASVQIDSGKLDAAAQVLQRAQQSFPAYPYTFQNLARLRSGQHKPFEAIALLRQEQQLAPSAHVLYRLAKAQELAGQVGEAGTTYARFEEAAKAQVNLTDNANRELILYYANQSTRAPQAMSLAQREIGLRHDVYTLDAYAWALYASGKYVDADVQMQKALAIGVRRADFFYHAGNIELKLHKQAEAATYFESLVQVNSSSEYAADARKTLNGLSINPLSLNPLSIHPSSDRTAATVVDALASSASASVAPHASVDSVSKASSAWKPDPVPARVPTVNLRPVPVALLTPRPTETERIIRTAQSRVKRNPNEAAAYSVLGAAFFQRARETGDVEDYQLAEQALTKSLDLVSADVSATAPLATMAEVCMGEHRFADALMYAQRSLSLGSGDLSPFAIVGDANADMGEYEKAAVAYSRMNSSDSATSGPRTTYARDSRLAYLRFISGDTDGAIGLMQSAVAAGVETRLPSENLAWLYFELGELYFQAGAIQAANDSYLTALTIHPGDYRALAGLGKVRANQGSYPEAILLYQKAIAVVPMPIYVAELGDLYTKIGNTTEAAKQYQLVEFIGLLGQINQVLHNRDLALFYADHGKKLVESLELAHKEFEVRHDVYTWDALAWSLYKNGKYRDAGDAMDHALRLGTRDSLLLFHAGMISAQLGQGSQAVQDLQRALKINPHFHVIYADAARRELALLQKQDSLSASGKQNHVQ